MSTGSLAKERYLLLLQQVQEEVGYGWQSEAARKLGVTQALISQMASGSRSPGLNAIDRAQARLRLDPSFFYDAELENPHYRNFIGRRPVTKDAQRRLLDIDPDSPARRVTEELIALEGDRMSMAHADELRAIDFYGSDVTIDMMRAFWKGMMLRDAGKPTKKPKIVKPPKRRPGQMSLDGGKKK